MATPHAVLVQRLSDLLGFEDGADDVLEHLVSIESSQDLSDYLSQLLGRNDDQVQSFVRNVGRFQRGEPLSRSNDDDDKQSAVERVPTERTYDATVVTKQKTGRPKQTTSKQKEQHATTRTIFGHPAQSAATKMATGAASTKPRVASKLQNNVPSSSTNRTELPPSDKPKIAPPSPTDTDPPATTTAQVMPPPKSHPPKGKASIVCGCFGSLHEPLTNCLFCGRISCKKEGYDYCQFCGMLVEQIDATAEKEGSKKAWEHKERLLRFDRDFARRTVVLDDQADFFVSNTPWLSEEERANAEEQQAERQEKLQTRKRQTLDIAF